MPLRRAARNLCSLSPQASRVRWLRAVAYIARRRALPSARRGRNTQTPANSDKGEEAERADRPKVKQEERPDAEHREAPLAQSKPAVAATQQETVVDKAAHLGTGTQPMDSASDDDSSSGSRSYSGAAYPPREGSLFPQAQSMCGRMMAVGGAAGTEPDAAGTEPEAAAAAAEKHVTNQEEELF